MKIKKTSETTPIQANVVNTNSNSTTDSYSCNYINENVIDILDLCRQNISPILYKGKLYDNVGLTVNTYSMKFEDGEYVSDGNNNAKGIYIQNQTGSTKTFVVELYFDNGGNYYTQYGSGTGTLPTMISTGAGRPEGYYASEFNSANTLLTKTYTVTSGRTFFIGSGIDDLPHYQKIICY